MLIDKIIKIAWSSSNKNWYVSKGYKFTKIDDEFEVPIEDLCFATQQSTYVNVKCDCEDCNNIESISVRKYLSLIKNFKRVLCKKHYYQYYNTYIPKSDYTELQVNNSNYIYKISNEDIKFAQQYVCRQTNLKIVMKMENIHI